MTSPLILLHELAYRLEIPLGQTDVVSEEELMEVLTEAIEVVKLAVKDISAPAPVDPPVTRDEVVQLINDALRHSRPQHYTYTPNAPSTGTWTNNGGSYYGSSATPAYINANTLSSMKPIKSEQYEQYLKEALAAKAPEGKKKTSWLGDLFS